MLHRPGRQDSSTGKARDHGPNRGRDLNPDGYDNIIFMIPDGCSQSIQTLARWYKGEDLTLDTMNAGMVRTDMANSVITDSASAATAFACGYKTTDGFLAVGPRSEDLLSTFPEIDPDLPYAPLATILELAKAKGKATGLVATSRITHATPAGFACHLRSRNFEYDIMEHMVYNDLTVALGGGRDRLLPNKRPDGENLEQVLTDRGYQVVTTRQAMQEASGRSKLWGAFAMGHLAPEMDRIHYNIAEPSLAEMTAKALEVLGNNRQGFFLMVEGSQVDWAGHNNDAGYMIQDFLAFDAAVKVAVDFAEAAGDTLVVAFPDHNTGGLKIGNYTTNYTSATIEQLVEPLKGMQISANMLVQEMGGDYGEANMIAKIKDFWNIDATADDVAQILVLAPEAGMSYALARVITTNHTILGWTTHGHNGEDVPLWIYPYTEAMGVIDNTALPCVIENWKGGRGPNTLDQLTDALFNNVEQAFPGAWSIDRTDPKNPVLVINGRRSNARLPINKDLLIINGRETRLGSIVVHAPLLDAAGAIVEDRVYIPDSAIKLIRAICRP